MKKFTYLFAFFALSFGLSINAQTAIDDLTDAKTWNSGDNLSIIIGHATAVGTVNNAYKNLGIGVHSLQDLTTGDANVAAGFGAGRNITTGQNNVAIGKEAGKLLTSGGTNTLLGNAAGDFLQGGSNNIVIGSGADVDLAGATGRIVIGKGATGDTDHTTILGAATNVAVYMSQDRQAIVYGGAIDLDPAADSGAQDVAEITLENDETISNGTDGTVVISGNLSVSSDMRLKDNIQPLGDTMINILKLDAKSYTREGREEIGLIAQDVQSVYPELVSEDRLGMLAVNYQALSAILINCIKDQEARTQELELLVKLLLEDK